jgi:hypothetical protein
MKQALVAALALASAPAVAAQETPATLQLSNAWVRLRLSGSRASYTGRITNLASDRIELAIDGLACGANGCAHTVSAALEGVDRLEVRRSRPVMVRVLAAALGAGLGFALGGALDGDCRGDSASEDQGCTFTRSMGAALGVGGGLFVTRGSWHAIPLPLAPGRDRLRQPIDISCHENTQIGVCNGRSDLELGSTRCRRVVTFRRRAHHTPRGIDQRDCRE